jgi:hypothetical protein
LVEPAFHLAQRRVDVRQRQHDIRGDPPGIAPRQVRIAVVQQMQRVDAFCFVRQVWRAVRREDLCLDAGGLHQLQPPLDVAG